MKLSIGQRVLQTLKTKPMRFQIRGVRFLEACNGRALIGDDMGLGKTLQALAWLTLHPDRRPVLIVCPANGKWNWYEQIRLHTGLKAQVLRGKKPRRLRREVLIINYEILKDWRAALTAAGIRVLIIDECHYVKTRKIARTKVCQILAKQAPHVIAMSGTPIINRPVEFFPVLNMIAPREFRSFWKYTMRYCDPKPGFKGRGWNFNGATNTEELHQRVKPYMIRRMKEDVDIELPMKRRVILPVEMSNRKDYERARDKFLEWLRDEEGAAAAKKAKKAQALVKLGQLKRLAAIGKMSAAQQWIDDYLESTNGKLVVFAHHHEVVDQLRKLYPHAAGGGSGKQRQDQVRRFQNDKKCRLFIARIKADGTGVTLTAAAACLFLELGWTPGEHDQAEDRINRIGQQAKRICAYYLLAKNSIDERVWYEVIEGKREIVKQILDGGRVSCHFDNLIKGLKEE